MFGILGDLTKAVVGVVIETPIAIAGDDGWRTDRQGRAVHGNSTQGRDAERKERDEA